MVTWGGHAGSRLVAAPSVGYLALLVTGLFVYRLSGVTFPQLFRVRRPRLRRREEPPPPVVASMANARQFAEAGRQIQAITMVRQLTGMSLEEAVAVVKEMKREQPW